MSDIIALVGESGSGKSTSLRNLDPDSTYIISVLNKPLPFKGSKAKFNVDNNNYKSTTDFKEIVTTLKKIDTNGPEINTIVIDDFQYLMANEFVTRVKESGWDKWNDMAQHVYKTIEFAKTLREDLTVVFVFHETNEGGRRKIKTLGKMLDEKITVEGLFTTVLYSEFRDGSYVFVTSTDGTTTAKSPMEMLPEVMDNDLQVVLEKMSEYNN